MIHEAKNTKNNILLVVIISVVIAFCVSLWYLRLEYKFHLDENKEVRSETGVWDLTDFDFDSGIVITTGDEEHIPGRLLTPDEFDDFSSEIQLGKSSVEVNTSRITFYMPDDSTYTIIGNSFDYAERIYINGEFVKDVGNVSLTADSSIPAHDYLNFSVTPENGVIEIVRQSNNFVHRDNGVAINLLIGTPDRMNRLYATEYGISGMIIGIFFTIAISHIFLFSLFNKHKTHLYFAILSITWGVRIGVTGIKVFGEWFPDVPWEVFFRLEYITVPLTSAMILIVANELFKNTLPKLYLKLFTGGFLIYSVACIFVPTIPLSYSMVAVQVAYIIAGVLLLVILFIKMRSMMREKEVTIRHLLFFVGLIPFALSAVHDALYYNGILIFGVNVLLIDLSLMILIFTQTAVIYNDTAYKLIASYRAEQEIRIEAASLRQAKKMHEDFLGTLSHEMQLPLTTVSGYAQLTGQILSEDELIDREYIIEKLRVIDDESRKLSRQVAQLLDVGAMDNGIFKPFLQKVDINALFSKIERLHFPIMNDGSNKLIVKCPKKTLFACADDERLIQCILNLLSNSVKHAKGCEIVLSATEENGFIEIAVSDNGKGIEPKLITNLFDKYPKHRSESGNGLGLYIVAQTIKAHGGEISASSKDGYGARIAFTIPIFKAN